MRRTLFMLVLVGSLLGTGVVAGFAAAGGSGTVDPPPDIAFLANGLVAADALAAGPIAGRLGAPLLTTEQAVLSEAAASGILAHAPELVIVLGGPVAVSDDVLDQLSTATGLPVLDPDQVGAGVDGIVRVAGGDRYATARAVADLIDVFDPGFLPVDATALGALTAGDSDTLDGLDADAFARSDQACATGQAMSGVAADGTATCAPDAVDGGDAETLDGLDATDLLADAPGAVTPTHLGMIPAARVTGQTAINSSAKLQFQTEVYDTDGLFDPAVPTTLTASIPGLYQVNAGVVFSGDTEGNRGLYITKGGTSVSLVEGDPEKTNYGLGLQTSAVVPFAAGEGVTVTAFESSPSTTMTTDPFAPNATFLELVWVGPHPDGAAATTAGDVPSTSSSTEPGPQGRDSH